MKKLFLISALLIFTCSSDLFAQDYMKMRKKQLRIEHQKKLKLIDSLSQELSLSNKKSQNLQSDLNNSSNDLILTLDSLKNSNLEINQLEVKLLASKNELSLLGLEIDNLVKESSNKTDLISNKNLLIDSLRTSLINISNEKIDLVSENLSKITIIRALEKQNESLLSDSNKNFVKYIKKHMLRGYNDLIYVKGVINEIVEEAYDYYFVIQVTNGILKGKEIEVYLQNGDESLKIDEPGAHDINYISFNDFEYGRDEGRVINLIVIKNYIYWENLSDGYMNNKKLAYKPILIWK
ncbi:MAG: hypothetical protein P8O09_06625 [Flavobacteriaceae bacterium]|nr:hypothetical protein [Flavobacteriaceae bacterium]